MRFVTRTVGIMLLPALLSCGKTLVGSDPANTPQNNFQILWDDFDRYYVFFLNKNVDWQALYDLYAPQVTDQTDDRALFDILSAMLAHLKDGHVNLIAPFKSINARYTYERPQPESTLNLDLVKNKYLNSEFQTTGNGFFIFGQISDTIGYLHIASFRSVGGNLWVEAIDPIVNTFFNHRGFIIDVRNNHGGSSNNADAIAGRFADQKRVSALLQSRNGPRHSDFGSRQKKYVEPAGNKQFTKPIVVLTDRITVSSAEYFVLAMKQFSYVTVLGDFTSGASGNNIYRELPNGWIYRLSVQEWLSVDNVSHEGVGIPPDIRVAISPSDALMEEDPVIEKAIQLLK